MHLFAFEALVVLSLADIYVVEIAVIQAKAQPENSIPEENPAAAAAIASSASQSTSCCVLGKA